MGSSFSHAADLPLPSSPAGGVYPPQDSKEAEAKTEEKVDYLNLPCPIPYEEIQREALSRSQLPSPISLIYDCFKFSVENFFFGWCVDYICA